MVAADTLNMHLQTAENGRLSRLDVERVQTTSHFKITAWYETQGLRFVIIVRKDLHKGRWAWDLVRGVSEIFTGQFLRKQQQVNRQSVRLRNEHILLFAKPEGKRPLGRHRRRWESNITMYFRECIGKLAWFIWLSIGTSGGLLWKWQWIIGVRKRRGISWLAEWLSASGEGLCCYCYCMFLTGACDDCQNGSGWSVKSSTHRTVKICASIEICRRRRQK
jgi:hypothetical protein